jgi:hypothetical protein
MATAYDAGHHNFEFIFENLCKIFKSRKAISDAFQVYKEMYGETSAEQVRSRFEF